MNIRRIVNVPIGVPVDVISSKFEGIFTVTIRERMNINGQPMKVYEDHNFPWGFLTCTITHWIDWEGGGELDENMTMRERSLFQTGLAKGMEIGIQGAVGARKV